MLTLLARVLARRLHLAELVVQIFSETVARMENLVVEGRLYERFGTNVRIDSPSGRRSSGRIGCSQGLSNGGGRTGGAGSLVVGSGLPEFSIASIVRVRLGQLGMRLRCRLGLVPRVEVAPRLRGYALRHEDHVGVPWACVASLTRRCTRMVTASRRAL
jgi:hypothetical protein